MLSGANDRVKAKLRKVGIIDLIGKMNNFKEFDEALVAVQENGSASNEVLSVQQMAVSDPVKIMLDISREYFLKPVEQHSKGD